MNFCDRCGQVTPDGVIVAAALAVVLVGLGLRLRCELRSLCACLTYSVICFVLSSAVDKQQSGQPVKFGRVGKAMNG